MKVAIFGSGHFGKCALQDYGCDKVECFIDNALEKAGKEVEGKKILSFDEFKKTYGSMHIVIAVNNFVKIAEQLRNEEFFDYEIYKPYSYSEFEDLKEAVSSCTDNIILVGIDDSTEMVYRAMLSVGVKKEQVFLSDIDRTGKSNYIAEECCYLLDSGEMNKTKYFVVSSETRAYAIQTYLQRQYPDHIILNPFITKRYGEKNKLVVNPYMGMDHDISEEEWIAQSEQEDRKTAIQEYMEELNKDIPFLEHIEIETVNRCNGGCDFCPVSVGNERRPEMRMKEELFTCIIDQLADRDYSGRLATFSNNEPFLDDRIVRFNKYAREKLPNARIHLFTNGTLLKLETFVEIMNYLDEIVIDNYNQQLELIPTVKKIVQYCEEHKELVEKVTVVTRKPHEIRTSRGGDAPNREKSDYLKADGKVSLCCNDPYGKYTLGDLSVQTIDEVWYGKEFARVRKAMLKGRKAFGGCCYCDTALMI